MIARLQNPITAMALSLVLSVGLGVALCWRAAGPLLQLAAAARPKPVVDVKKDKGWDFWTIEMENLSTDLSEERARLRKQSDLLDQRAARLEDEQKQLAKIRTDLEGLRQEIAAKVVEIGADEAKNLRALSQTYANLSPRAVVAIFREMDDLTVVKILSLMKPDVVGPIFEEMSKTAGPDGPLAKRAAVLSEKLRLVKSAQAPAPS
jgi:flagellar motility protein MotE (MotC chaperone)